MTQEILMMFAMVLMTAVLKLLKACTKLGSVNTKSKKNDVLILAIFSITVLVITAGVILGVFYISSVNS